MNKQTLLVAVTLLLVTTIGYAQGNKKGQEETFTVMIKVIDKNSKEPMPGSIVMVENLNIFGVTDTQGICLLKRVTKGEMEVQVKVVGYESYNRRINVIKNLEFLIPLEETSLTLNEVTVTAKSSAAGTSTGSTIGRQAIDHLQANSLKDLMELLPGQLATNNSLTSKQTVQLRSATTDVNNAFGVSIIVDGVPISNNTTIGSGSATTTSITTGTDLRQVNTDDIESVEVIRGIPSAEYGDLTSGAVIVNTRNGATPFEVRAKVNPTTLSGSVNKGFKFDKKGGSLNAGFNYAQAWGDPRSKTETFDRLSGSVNYSNTFFKNWNTSTKIGVSTLIDNSKRDPDQLQNGTFTKEKSLQISLSHNGKISVNKLLMRTLSYTVGMSASNVDMQKTQIVGANGFIPILNATTSGYFPVEGVTQSYSATGGTQSTPRSLFAKVTNGFTLKAGKVRNNIKMGVEYKYDSNKGVGVYNQNPDRPLRPNADGRPRPYYDIPALSQLSGYVEDNINYLIRKRRLSLTAGLRYSMLQPGMQEQVWSLSPRINFSAEIMPWLLLRAGYGVSSKTPGLGHLYPDKKYYDRQAAAYTYRDAAGGALLRQYYYHTYVYDVQRSVDLINSNNEKYEVGLDFRLPNDRKISIVYYNDRTLNGFGNFTDYHLFTSQYRAQGTDIPIGRPSLEYMPVSRTDTVWGTTGRVGNTEISFNQGVELEASLGRIEVINTSFFLTAAWNQTRQTSNNPVFSSPSKFRPSINLYPDNSTVPYKVEFPAGTSTSISERITSVLRGVYNIPRLGLVASASAQFSIYNYNYTTNQRQMPVAFIRPTQDLQLVRTTITPQMWADPTYQIIPGFYLKDEINDPKDSPPSKSPMTWTINLRLTKDISKIANLSFYANNILFYEPWRAGNNSSTLIERNTGTFAFGLEITLKI